DAILNARRYRDAELVMEPLGASMRDLVLQRRFDLVFSMFDAIARTIETAAPRGEATALKGDLARGMFSPETLRLLVKEAVRAPSPGGSPSPAAPVDLDAIARDLAPVLAVLGPSHLDAALDLLATVPHEGIKRALFNYLERALPGREAEITDR